MNILFIGTVFFSKAIFDVIKNSENNLVGVIGKKNKKFNSDYFDLVKYSKKKKINSIYGDKINSNKTIKWIKEKKPDLIFCIGWNSLLKKEILKIPHLGVIGYHPSDLPKNRGRHPIIWALALGLDSIYSTFYFMKAKADDGDIILKKKILIKKNSNAQLLYNQLIVAGKRQTKKILHDLGKGFIKTYKQKNSNSNFWRKRNFNDGAIDWRMSADSIYNLVRALSKPYPGAFFIYSKKKICVWKSKIVNVNLKNLEPGKILDIKKGKPIIKCGDKALKLENYTPYIKFKNNNYL